MTFHRRLLLAWTVACALACRLNADGLRAELVSSTSSRESQVVTIDLSWRGSWRDGRNHDAVWVVVRSHEAGLHRLEADGHRVLSNNRAVEIHPSADGVGAFVFPAKAGSGPLEVRIDLVLVNATPNSLDVWALEMVAIPAGPFEVGDDAPAVVATGALHTVGPDGKPAGTYRIESEAALELSRKPGGLWYGTEVHTGYQGDREGPIPEAFPKGTESFYIMKFELMQGQYARFLNALPRAARAARAPLELQGEEAGTWSIGESVGRFAASAPDRPCNFVTWDDTCAFADWMGLRPMTELEFEKASRGPKRPVAGDFPWGTNSSEGVERIVLPGRDLAVQLQNAAQLLDDSSRVALGASYYRVMDLSGSLWERVITLGHPAGRAFQGSLGDGRLDPAGTATNPDWPRLDEDGRNAFGIGFRGGAEYFAPTADVTNPFSCVATRTYAAWEGGYRYKTYSARAVRQY